MAIREGRWDCTFCGTTGILGRHTTCTGCGRSRPEGVKFYLVENEAEVTDQKLLKLAEADADWICQYCDSSNRANQTSCQHCSAPRDADTPIQLITEYEEDQAPEYGDNNHPEPVVEAQPKPKSKWKPLLGCLGAVVVVLLLLCGVMSYISFKTYEVELTVTDVAWERTIPVEAYRTVEEGDWTIPEGGRQLASEQKIHHYDQVVDHYDTKTREVCEDKQTGTETYTCGKIDKGNGFFADKQCTRPVYREECHDETYRDPVYRDEPVYQTWYTYEIEKWVLDRTEKASGQTQDVYWPEYTLADNERVGQRTETYEVHFVDQEGQSYTQSFDYERWQTYQAEGRYLAYVDFFGQVTEIEPGG